MLKTLIKFKNPRNSTDKELMKLLMRLLPKKYRHSLFRKSIKLDFQGSQSMQFKIAESKAELEAAFRLIYQIYLKKNLIVSSTSEMKLNKIYALPTTKILIAKKDKKVIGVLCLSLENEIQTTCEEQFDLSSLKENGKSFVEISSFVWDLAENEDYKAVLFPLCKLGLQLNRSFFKADYIVTAIAAEDFDYWHSLFLFDKISEKNVRFHEFNGRSAVCVFSDIKKLEAKFVKKYSKKKKAKNLHKYLFADEDPRIQIPAPTEIVAQRHSAEILDYFFNVKSNIFAHLTSFETRVFHKLYDEASYSEILPKVEFRSKFENQRNVRRHHAHLTGKIMRENTDQFGSPITVKTVSLNGVGAISEQKLLTEKTYKMKINIGEEQQIEILVSPVWSGRDHTYGFSIRSQSTEWTRFINSLANAEKKSA